MNKEETLQQLEQYPHIQEKLRMVWGDEELVINLIETLLHDTRDGTRMGFPQDVVKLFLKILDHHDTREFKDLAEHAVEHMKNMRKNLPPGW